MTTFKFTATTMNSIITWSTIAQKTRQQARQLVDFFSHQYVTLIQLIKLPVARLHFDTSLHQENIESTYRYFTKPHPKYKVFANKSLGAALIDLTEIDSRDKYMERIKGKNSASQHAKKAKSKGYVFSEIDRNRYIDDIHEINTSLQQRQGRTMERAYLEKKFHFDRASNFRYFGILASNGKLMAYGNVGLYGNFAALSQLMGHRNNDGIMHALMIEITCRLIDDGSVEYLMYDTFFGALPGLRLFKTMLGFKPYRAKYTIQ